MHRAFGNTNRCLAHQKRESDGAATVSDIRTPGELLVHIRLGNSRNSLVHTVEEKFHASRQRFRPALACIAKFRLALRVQQAIAVSLTQASMMPYLSPVQRAIDDASQLSTMSDSSSLLPPSRMWGVNTTTAITNSEASAPHKQQPSTRQLNQKEAVRVVRSKRSQEDDHRQYDFGAQHRISNLNSPFGALLRCAPIASRAYFALMDSSRTVAAMAWCRGLCAP